jgi:S1-C subfamily serine protease
MGEPYRLALRVARLPGDNPGILQMSAPVQSGNSGAPLIDQSGNVIGVVT